MIACTIYLMIEHKEKLLSLYEKLLSVDHSSNRGESTLNTNCYWMNHRYFGSKRFFLFYCKILTTSKTYKLLTKNIFIK